MLQNLFNNGSDMKSVIQNMVAQNPKIKPLIDSFNSSGMTAKQFFYQYAQQNGINPNEFLNS